MSCYTFSQARVTIYEQLPERNVIIIGGGRPPKEDWLTRQIGSAEIYCADSGINVCRQYGIVPDKLIGDADSADKDSWEWGKRQNVSIDQYPSDKDYTDLQLALKTIGKKHKQATVLLTGGFAGRLDHLLSNIYSLIWSQEWGVKPLGIADDQEMLFLINGPGEIKLETFILPRVISLISLTALCSGVCSTGLHWNLKGELLEQNRPYTISNRLASKSNEFSVKLQSGCLGIYLSNFSQAECR